MSTWFSRITELFESRKAIGQKVEKAAVDLPVGAGTVDDDLFTVSGGRVLLTELEGQATAAIAAGVSMVVSLRHVPTTGLAAATDMCLTIAGLDTNTDAEDTLYHITGDPTVALAGDAAAGVAVPSFGTNQQILQPGTVQMRSVNTGAGGTGAIKWTLHYVPIDDGAVVTAA